MIWLFEDKEDDELSVLLRLSMPVDIADRFRYADGNGNLPEKAEELLSEGDYVLVLLDTVPGNKSIRDIYLRLRRLSRQHDYRLIIWNIVCAEYYFIKAFAGLDKIKAFDYSSDLEIVLSKLPYKNAELMVTERDRAFTKTFEKFCKLYILKKGNDCINISKEFFKNNCACGEQCDFLSLIDKSVLYKKSYTDDGCFVGVEEAGDIDTENEKLWQIHQILLENANEMI